jgi:hypothetical protein
MISTLRESKLESSRYLIRKDMFSNAKLACSRDTDTSVRVGFYVPAVRRIMCSLSKRGKMLLRRAEDALV